MKINKNTTLKIAKLSRIKIKDEEIEEFSIQLSSILDWVEQLNEVNTDNVEPLIYMSEEKNILRSDNIKDEVSQKDALKNAPKKDSDYFKVPTILKK